MRKMEIGVIGLGKFGSAVAKAIAERGHSVVGIDRAESTTKRAKDFLRQVYRGDATDAEVLKQLRFMDLDKVIVSVGKSMENSILIVLNLQELGIRNAAVKALSNEHASVLRRLGVEEVIRPEQDAAEHLAHQVSNPGMLDLLPIGGDVLLQELEVDQWTGKLLGDLNIMDNGVMIVAVKPKGEKRYIFVPSPEMALGTGDVLIAIGKEDDVLGLVP
ncbi:MAG: TrkA family potassium uptake protein [Desulfovibrionales bacterium]|nr:TrkA family potassium uptake protein [Desulfovibrionales bacterium]